MFLNMVSVDAFLISDGSSFQSPRALTLNALPLNLSLVRGRLIAVWSAGLARKLAAACH